MTDISDFIPRRTSIQSIENPEWGTWGIMEDKGYYFEIYGRSGGRVLSKAEAQRFWRVAPKESQRRTRKSRR